MPRFEELAPDQKAVLQLLLKQGKSYGDIAGLLRLDQASVRERALDALDALGADAPGAADLPPERQDELADHLLLQQSASERRASRTFLEGSAPGRAWARTVAGELRPVGGDALPEIPAEPAEVAAAFDALDERTAAREHQRSSKLGGILVIGLVVAIIAVVAILVLKKGDSPSTSAATTTAAATSATGTSGAAGSLADQQINLTAPSGGSKKALGVAIVQQGGLALQAQGVPASTLYKVWLWNTASDALPLGYAKYDAKTKRIAGSLQSLPAEAASYGNLVITRETSTTATKPGTVVLRGALKRG
jgi:hypothetical protein